MSHIIAPMLIFILRQVNVVKFDRFMAQSYGYRVGAELDPTNVG